MPGSPKAKLETVAYHLNGSAINARPGETILESAARHGVEIPHLCHKPGLRPDGNCRACLVEIEGERVLAIACCRRPTPGMAVRSDSERARRSQRLVLELLRSDVSGTPQDSANELGQWCQRLAIAKPRFPEGPQPPADLSHPAIAVRLDACIQCTRCLRACREIQVNDVIGYAHRGAASRIVFDLDALLRTSSCVGCGECVQACPTSALAPAGASRFAAPEKAVDSLCPYCGVGCQLRLQVKDNRILRVEGRAGPANQGRLCIKGRFGFDYVQHRERLTRPLVRRDGVAKTPNPDFTADLRRVFREATWEEAMQRAAAGFRDISERHGPHSLAGFGSAKGSNEEAYLFQKLIRTGFHSNNVDHCTRLCHASSVAALMQMIGSGAVSNPVADVRKAEVILVIGSNTTENHPVAASFMKNAAHAGKTLIVMDPRRTALARHADYFLQFRPDTDVAMLNGMMQTLIEEDLTNDEFIASRTTGFAALKAHLAAFPAERVAPICGISARTLRQVARVYAGSRGSMIFWGMGISQHVHGTDNARCLINLALLTGQIGRPGSGLHPLRGQNNVQGASDAGLIPMVFPDYQRVDEPEARRRFESLWGAPLDARPGLTVVEIMHAIGDADATDRIRGMYIMGENPAMSDPNLPHARHALSRLDHLVVQDIFPTETVFYADVVLPASAFPEKTGSFTNTDRRVQLGRQALAPPGEARADLEILVDMARHLGLDWQYAHPRAVFEEMRRAMPSMAGITWERLEREGSVTYPCRREGDPGEEVLFGEVFPTADGKGHFAAAPFSRAAELPDAEFPWILITGRRLEHWHTGAMTRRSRVLDAIQPAPTVDLHPTDLDRLAAGTGDPLRIRSRRGEVVAYARADPGMQPGQVHLPFCYREAAANLLTIDALDPDGKIPEFKFCAVRIEPA